MAKRHRKPAAAKAKMAYRSEKSNDVGVMKASAGSVKNSSKREKAAMAARISEKASAVAALRVARASAAYGIENGGEKWRKRENMVAASYNRRKRRGKRKAKMGGENGGIGVDWRRRQKWRKSGWRHRSNRQKYRHQWRRSAAYRLGGISVAKNSEEKQQRQPKNGISARCHRAHAARVRERCVPVRRWRR
jgi:hypothetical protein